MPHSPRIGTGITVAFGTSTYAPLILGIDWSGFARPAVDVSHHGTPPAGAGLLGSKEFLAGKLSDPGEITLELLFDPDFDPPLEGAAETVTLTFPKLTGQTTGATWAASCICTGFSFGVPLEDKLTGKVTLKVTGNVTTTAGS